MKKLFFVLLIILVFSFPGRYVFAQGDGMPNRALDDTGPHSKMDPGYSEQWGRRPPLTGAIDEPTVREARVLKKGILAPSLSDRMAFADFLLLPNSGLIRLLPRRLRQSKFYTEPPVKINGDGAYYSFAFLTHQYGYGSDLELGTTLTFKNTTELPPSHYLQVGFAGTDFGMLTNLGGLPLETLTFDDPRTAFLREYKAPQAEAEARREFRRFANGVTIDGQTYQRTLPIQVGATYLLRSINYDESDLLVAFRVVREDTDQSLIIAWQMLKRFPTPRLKNKSE